MLVWEQKSPSANQRPGSLQISHLPHDLSKDAEGACKEILLALALAGEKTTFNRFYDNLPDSLRPKSFQYDLMRAHFTDTSELGSTIAAIIDAEQISMAHLTRSMGSSRQPTVPGFKIFGAGKFGAHISTPQRVPYVVVQTEERVGHLNDIDPGATVVGGYVAVVDDLNSTSGAVYLSVPDMKNLLAGLIMRFN